MTSHVFLTFFQRGRPLDRLYQAIEHYLQIMIRLTRRQWNSGGFETKIPIFIPALENVSLHFNQVSMGVNSSHQGINDSRRKLGDK
jgi:hypothetical protein